jgi:hypothetical protein
MKAMLAPLLYICRVAVVVQGDSMLIARVLASKIEKGHKAVVHSLRSRPAKMAIPVLGSSEEEYGSR